MLQTLSLARRPCLKLHVVPRCTIVAQWLRLQHGHRLSPTVHVPDTPPRGPPLPSPPHQMPPTPGFPDSPDKIPTLPPTPSPHPCPRKPKSTVRRGMERRPMDPAGQRPFRTPLLEATASQHAQPVDPTVRKVLDALDQFRDGKANASVTTSTRADPSLQEHLTGASFQGMIQRLWHSPASNRVVDLIRLGNSMSLTVPPSTFLWLCAQAAELTQWDLVVELADMGVDQCGPSEGLLYFRYRALTKQSNYRWLRSALNDLADAGIKPGRKMFHFMLESALDNLDIARAQRIMEAMQEHGVPVKADTHALLARRHRKVGADDAVENNAIAALPNLQPPSQVSTMNSLIRGHIESGAVRRALRLLSLFDQESVETIIEVVSGNGGAGEMADSVSYPEPLPEPPSADATTYSTFIYWCSHNRNLSGALRLLQSMIMSGTPMAEDTIAALVETCFTCGRPDLAVQLVAGVCNPETTPATTFIPLHPEAWPEHCFEIHIPGLKPTTKIFNRFLRGALHYYGLDGAKHVLHIMEKNNVVPNGSTVKELMGHILYVEHSHPRTMIRVLQSLTGPHLLPTQEHIGFIISCIQRAEIYQLHGRGWERLKFGVWSHKIREKRKTTTSPDFESFAGMIMPTFRGYRALMEPFLRDIRFRDTKPNARIIGHRIRHEAVINMDMDTAYDVFETMLARGIKASIHHYNALAQGYSIRGDTHRVRHVMQEASKAGIRPDRDSYTILLMSYSRRGDPEGTLKVLEEMVEAGIQPDVPSIDAAAGSFYAQGKNTMAKKVLIKLWSFVGEFPEEMRTATVLELVGHFRTLHRQPRNHRVSIPREAQKNTNKTIHRLTTQWKTAVRELRKNAEIGRGDKWETESTQS